MEALAYGIVPTDILPDCPRRPIGRFKLIVGGLKLFLPLSPRSFLQEHLQIVPAER
jgi:hypothetical protein